MAAVTGEEAIITQVTDALKKQMDLQNKKLLEGLDHMSDKMVGALAAAMKVQQPAAPTPPPVDRETEMKNEFRVMMKELLKEAGVSQPVSAPPMDLEQKFKVMLDEQKKALIAEVADKMSLSQKLPGSWRKMYDDAWSFAEEHPWFTAGMLLLAAGGAVVAGYSIYSWTSSRINVSVDMLPSDGEARLRAM